MTTRITLLTLVMLCWIVMFLSGQDVWTSAGRPDVWHQSGPPYPDLRAFLVAFYLQFVILAAMTAVTVRTALRRRT